MELMNVRECLQPFIAKQYQDQGDIISAYLPDLPIRLSAINAVMISEVVAGTPAEDFYSLAVDSDYMQTTKAIFHKAGAEIAGIEDILNQGIYITSAIKMPKQGTAIDPDLIKKYVPLLEKELELFPSLKVIMVMGDVAKKAVNLIFRKEAKKNIIPSGSTYKIRHTEINYQGIRFLPAYIMTGKNLAIEKSKIEMSAEEVSKMMRLIGS